MRIKRGVNAVKKRRKILKLAKGYFGAKSKNYRIARQAVMKSFNYAYIGRRLKKRDFRNLWIARINAARAQTACLTASSCTVSRKPMWSLTEKFWRISP